MRFCCVVRARAALRPSTWLPGPGLEETGNLGPETRLDWDDISLFTKNFGAPELILENLKDRFLFREEDPDTGTDGLRPPQLGAYTQSWHIFQLVVNSSPRQSCYRSINLKTIEDIGGAAYFLRPRARAAESGIP
ncbi:hypothetical protein [Roseovarius sp. MMSF_3281]|uniref:hypothetical protein n=1 Tax=Roseovarius sp. MMSF_3281 TaxID=3046694 RepID=UPI00273F9200|nr:hypothetical protein [Roseovarius sp. MMSF_3281]